MKHLKIAVFLAAAFASGVAFAAKERVVVVPAHPDDLIPCFGTCLLSKDVFEWHVIEFTHGERGMGEQGFRDGSTKRIRMAEEGRARPSSRSFRRPSRAGQSAFRGQGNETRR